MARRLLFAIAPLSASALWGGMYVVSKWGFSAIPPITLGFLRVVFGALALYTVVKLRFPSRSFSSHDTRQFVILGGWITVTIVTQFVGTDLTNASQGALLTVLTPVFTLALGVTVLSESFSGRKLLGMSLAALGTLLVLTDQYDLSTLSASNVVGVVALIAASLAWAGYTVWGKPLVRKYTALETATYSTLASVPMLGVLVPFELTTNAQSLSAATFTVPVIGAVLYLGLMSTAAAWYLWYKGLEFVDAGTVAVFFFAQPVVGAALGALLLDEHLGLPFLVGGAVMSVGVYLVSTATNV